jgi:hypothetical protein
MYAKATLALNQPSTAPFYIVYVRYGHVFHVAYCQFTLCGAMHKMSPPPGATAASLGPTHWRPLQPHTHMLGRMIAKYQVPLLASDPGCVLLLARCAPASTFPPELARYLISGLSVLDDALTQSILYAFLKTCTIVLGADAKLHGSVSRHVFYALTLTRHFRLFHRYSSHCG